MPSKNIKCLNCGFYGHTCKNCNYPITSYGLICTKFVNNKINYLMIQRKDTLCYTEFIRGKYNIENISYISGMFSRMTKDEQNNIRQKNFDYLWSKLWLCNNRSNADYASSKRKFEQLKIGFTMKTLEGEYKIINLQEMLPTNKEHLKEREWEFPKGRRKLNEEDLNCAVREFKEETGIDEKDIEVIHHVKPYESIYQGTNKLRYKSVFFLSKYTSNVDNVCVNKNNITQIKEVKDVRWFSTECVLNKLKVGPIEKIELFTRINVFLLKHLKL